jgi:hypothetical protein
MEKYKLKPAVIFLAVFLLTSHAESGIVPMDQALQVAKNWIASIIDKKGDWGGAQDASIRSVKEFKRFDRLLGYCCHIDPKGFIIVSLREELAPVKAYSAVSDLDPVSEEGMSDMLKYSMERILDRIETSAGPIKSVTTKAIKEILEIDYSKTWEQLMTGPILSEKMPEPVKPDANYQEGDVMCSSNWDQHDPYNQHSPTPVEVNDGDCGETRCTVGCVATAGAQIMRYWCWPPYGIGSNAYYIFKKYLSASFSDSYDWPNMPDEIDGSSAQAEIDAVSEICYEVGVANEMGYCQASGCGSGADTPNMPNVYHDNFRYSSSCSQTNRDDAENAGNAWFERMKDQFNLNRPVHYHIPGHSLISDGWQEIGNPVVRQYHLNYGWSNASNNTWYTLDALPHHDPNDPDNHPDKDFMLEDIYPEQALGSLLMGTYAKDSFPYRYFDRDAISVGAIFASGQYLQFLPGITVTCMGTAGSTIFFNGSSSNNTRLFTRGDPSTGIRIYEGAVKLSKNGSITLK